jgi:hypothetical protein
VTPAPVQALLHHRPLRFGWGLLLALALLWAQWLGQLHHARHAFGPHAPQASVHHHEASAPAAQAHAGAGLLAHLLAPDGDELDCRLYDQYGQADSLPALPLLALPVVLALVVSWVLVRHRPATSFALFDARGPPRVC